jgi:hypothetical protein
MDTTILVEKNIEEGKRLIETLDKTDFEVWAALWFYSSDSKEWQLLIASPFVEKKDLEKAYSFIRSVLEQLSPPSEISTMDISAVSPRHYLVRALNTKIHTGPGISGIRLTRNVIDNTFIDDVYIYRVNLPQAVLGV